MHAKGRPLDEVRKALSEARSRDFSYADGDILGSMCTAPADIALEAAALFAETNLGDPAHFPGTRALEAAYLDALRGLTHAPDGSGALFTSGGTEGNILAVHAAREAWRARGQSDVRPNLIVPEAAHFSFEKARRLTDVEIRYAAVDERHRVRPDAVEPLIDDNTCLIVGIAGTTEVGAIDPLGALDQVAQAHGVPLHVDAALGGFVLPFLKDAGRPGVAWDFQLPSVTSITLDPHKMGTSVIPGGAFLTRTATWLDRIAVETPYVTTTRQSGILGTRPGAAAAAAWATAEQLGRDGYTQIVQRTLETTAWLRDTLERRGVRFIDGDLNVVLVRCTDPLRVQEELSAKGWRVNAVPRLGGIRLVVMPHVTRDTLERFLPDLFDVLEAHPAPGQTVERLRQEAC